MGSNPTASAAFNKEIDLKLLGNIPNKVGLAFSGGSDSVFALDFLRRSKEVILVHFIHGKDEFSQRELEFTRETAKLHDLELILSYIPDRQPKKESKEVYWRTNRYAFFHSLEIPIITAHHLDDAVETYVMTCLHGQGRIIPYSNRNVIRPFLLTSKTEILNWLERKELSYLKDPSNQDISIPRNRVRHKMMEDILHINPGIHKVVSNKVLARYIEDKESGH